MATYAIKDLEKLCGIKAHTIRIWEQRYDIIKPKRTKTNIRFYTDADLKLLKNVALLNRNGIKISKIAKMSESEIEEKVFCNFKINFEGCAIMDALTISMIEMNELKFDQIVTTNIRQIGFERTMLEIIYPFLDKLSLLWLMKSINSAQENFMSNLIRQKIMVAIDNLPFSEGRTCNKFLIFLPEGEKQDLSILFMHFLIKCRKNQVFYLGRNISTSDLAEAYNIIKPNYIFSMITETYSDKPVQQYVNQLSASFPDCKILLSGHQIITQNVKSNQNVTVLKSLFDTIDFLDSFQNRKTRHCAE